MEHRKGCKVCVTGGAGYIGSWLVKKLLGKGYTVHATLRNLDDKSKVSLLKSLPGADDERLVLFKADIYSPDDFKPAIDGCDYVFHVATPMQHSGKSKDCNNIAEATIFGAKRIANLCLKSTTVRKLIYTASVVSASPIKRDGSGFNNSMDETCWTPLNLSDVPYNQDFLQAYLDSKTVTEKELLNFGEKIGGDQLEIVTLGCGLVGGDTLLSYIPYSFEMIVSQLTNKETEYQILRYLEELIGKIPIAHIDDVCEAHIFCMENPLVHGRILCSNSYISSAEIADYYQQNYPEFHVKQEYLDLPNRKIKWASTRIVDKGFEYKYDIKMILDECISCARRIGYL